MIKEAVPYETASVNSGIWPFPIDAVDASLPCVSAHCLVRCRLLCAALTEGIHTRRACLPSLGAVRFCVPLPKYFHSVTSGVQDIQRKGIRLRQHFQLRPECCPDRKYPLLRDPECSYIVIMHNRIQATQFAVAQAGQEQVNGCNLDEIQVCIDTVEANRLRMRCCPCQEHPSAAAGRIKNAQRLALRHVLLCSGGILLAYLMHNGQKETGQPYRRYVILVEFAENVIARRADYMLTLPSPPEAAGMPPENAGSDTRMRT